MPPPRAVGRWQMILVLKFDALGGAPGVYSARYTGEHCSYLDNCNKLLFEIDGQTNRRARFRTVLAPVNLSRGSAHLRRGNGWEHYHRDAG